MRATQQSRPVCVCSIYSSTRKLGRRSDHCYLRYHPAPLTKPRSSPGVGARRSSLAPSRPTTTAPYPSITTGKTTSGILSPPLSTGTRKPDYPAVLPVDGHATAGASVLQSPTSLTMAPTPSEDRGKSSSASFASPETGMSFRDDRVGFLGPTSYSAVFTENAALRMGDEEVEDASSSLPPLTADKIQQGAEVLALLRDMPLYRQFAQRYFDLCDGMIVYMPAFRGLHFRSACFVPRHWLTLPRSDLGIWMDELWSEFGQLLVDGQPDELRSLSEHVWRNTQRPMKIHAEMTATEWARYEICPSCHQSEPTNTLHSQIR